MAVSSAAFLLTIIFNNSFMKCVLAYPYCDPIGVGKVNKLFYWFTGGYRSGKGLSSRGVLELPLMIIIFMSALFFIQFSPHLLNVLCYMDREMFCFTVCRQYI